MPLSVFVTVGTTKFDALVELIATPRIVNALNDLGFTDLVLQHGNSSNPFKDKTPDASKRIKIFAYDFKPSLRPDMEAAALIISHAGTGTIIESLGLKKRLIAVPNPTLMHNHQLEFALALEEEGNLVTGTLEDLEEVLLGRRWENVKDRPPGDISLISSVFEEEAGFRPRA
ncbi:N-acetylglucosaminyldiphosphodolichol N-acetylglucosaminyltransferase catalytic subunit alg13 [Irineochytrium annulatum]|nr:N-acetylglucosaminyldiphosphodolichol N-acetylglucosaminyltransferase catalytic subunit alg13 [Irineochytrium annulatum]